MVRRRAAVRTLGQQAKVWSVRVLLNLLVLALLGAAFYGVYWATGATVELQVRRALGEGLLWAWDPIIQGWRALKSRIPAILGGMGCMFGLRGAGGGPSSRTSLLGPPCPPGAAPCPASATGETRGGLPSVHLHLGRQLLAAPCVQPHCPAGGLHQEPPNCFYPAQVLAFGGGRGMVARLV